MQQLSKDQLSGTFSILFKHVWCLRPWKKPRDKLTVPWVSSETWPLMLSNRFYFSPVFESPTSVVFGSIHEPELNMGKNYVSPQWKMAALCEFMFYTTLMSTRWCVMLSRCLELLCNLFKIPAWSQRMSLTPSICSKKFLFQVLFKCGGTKHYNAKWLSFHRLASTADAKIWWAQDNTLFALRKIQRSLKFCQG